MSFKFCFLLESTSSKGSLGLYSFNSEKKRNIIKAIELKSWESSFHSTVITSYFSDLLDTFHTLNLKTPKPISKSFKKKQALANTFLALGVGPGRFTGLRVGISFAKTLGFALNIPLYPVSSLKILAESQKEEKKPILVLLNGFKNSLYIALYRRKNSIMEELIPACLVLAKDLHTKIKTKCICVGDGYEAYKDVFPSDLKQKLQVKEDIFPNTKYLSYFLEREFSSSHLVSWENLKPMYLKSPVRLMV